MSITLHCESCKKKIVAPDTAGGKWGKCPFCNHRCYVPLPESEGDEELKLAPVDETEEKQYEQMMKETQNITQSLLHEKEDPQDSDAPQNPNGTDASAMVIKYLRFMADGSLDEARKAAEQIMSNKAAAKAFLKSLLKEKIPVAQLQDIPQKVLEGFIKTMLAKL
ncbi:MAG: hypothetical protein CVV39_07085 [Planctomycetes bacterium HGW-Planctomycetes-1]|nr:MAG: hypothetical protein CVV39_07085 [Planctomycetes bacterium HGW-Planctomycetes-1]